MAKNPLTERSQNQFDQERSLARREFNYPLPNFGGDLFSMSPFALLREMTDWMDRSIVGTPFRTTSGGRETAVWSPAIEVREKDNNLIVSADLPGIDQKDVKVEVDNDMLVIQGERKQEYTEEREGWHRTERSYGSFYRTIPLPDGAKTEEVKANFRNGVLEVIVPLTHTKSNRKQIQVNASSGAAVSGASQR